MLSPGIVFEIMNALAVVVAQFLHPVDGRAMQQFQIALGPAVVIAPLFGSELRQAGLVKMHGVGGVGDHIVGIFNVMDPGHMYFANALDTVVAEAALKQGRALQGFGHDKLRPRIAVFQGMGSNLDL
jgi:hypothetical protein